MRAGRTHNREKPGQTFDESLPLAFATLAILFGDSPRYDRARDPPKPGCRTDRSLHLRVSRDLGISMAGSKGSP